MSLKYVAEGGSFAEEVFSSVRTAHAFGTQKKLGDLYDVRVNNSYKLEAKKAIFQGVGLGVSLFYPNLIDIDCLPRWITALLFHHLLRLRSLLLLRYHLGALR